MPGTPELNPLEVFVEVRCLCGQVHAFFRDKVIEGLSVSRWKCGGCKRRFVIACAPGLDGRSETYWPVFLDNVPSTGSTIEDGSSSDAASSAPPAAEVHFQCRCGCRLVARSHTLDRPTRCPKCVSKLVVRAGYKADTGNPVPILEYPEDEKAADSNRRPLPRAGDDDPWRALRR